MIKAGFAYADDTPGEEMKKERDAGIESKYRNASVEDNLKRFALMLQGKHDEDPKTDEKDVKKGKEGGKKGGKEEQKKKEEKKEESKAPVEV